jgi:hypothetical protein
MRKKIFINVFYNIAIFICALLIYNGFMDKHYEYVAGGLFIGAIFIVLKIRLIKEVRDMQK